MNKGIRFFIGAALIAAIGTGAWYYFAPPPAKPEREQAKDALQDAVGLALKGIELVQGEKGIELWRMKATWAALRQEKGVIDVDSPDIVYRVGDDEIPLHVVADKGQVLDGQKFLRLWDHVVCTYKDNVLRAPLMTYNSTSRLMVFPDGADIEGTDSKGKAKHLTWDLVTNVIEGTGGVRVDWNRGSGTAHEGGTSSGADAPPATNSSPVPPRNQE